MSDTRKRTANNNQKTIESETGDVTLKNAVMSDPMYGDGKSNMKRTMKNMHVSLWILLFYIVLSASM